MTIPRLPDRQDDQWDCLARLLAVEGDDDGQVSLSGMTRRHRRVTLTVGCWGEDMIGFRLVPFGSPTQLADWAKASVCVGLTPHPVRWQPQDGQVLISGDTMKSVRVSMNPFRIEVLQGAEALWRTSGPLGTVHERSIAPLTGWYDSPDGRYPSVARLSAFIPASVHLSGLGERFFAARLEGRTVQSWNEDADGVRTKAAYKTIPFVVSDQGWGLWFNSPGLSEWDLGDSATLALTITTPQSVLEWCVITGATPKHIVQRYVSLTGRPDTMPAWAAGIWLSTGSTHYQAQDEIVSIVGQAEQRDFPADVLFVDAHWQMPGAWGGAQWNRAAIPQPRAMIRDLRAAGYHVALWSQPYLEEGSPAFSAAAAAGMLLRRLESDSPWLANLWGDADPVLRSGVMDFTHPKVKQWYADQYHDVLTDGVEILNVDFGEEVPAESRTAGDLKGADIHNLYALEYARTVYETVTSVQPDGMVLIRPGYSGIQRFPAAWPGDPHPTLDDLRLTVQGGIHAAASGIAYWAVDVGGYKEEPTPEAFVRWAQFALFAPLTRFHRIVKALPWEYGEAAFQMIRQLAHLRYRFAPYLRALYHEAHARGTPVLRPLWMEFPRDPQSWSGWTQYLLGDALLVAPVTTSSGVVSFHVPEGRWLDWFRHDLIVGPCDVVRQESLDTFPLLMREGFAVPMLKNGFRSRDELQDSVELVYVAGLAAGQREVFSRDHHDGTIQGSFTLIGRDDDTWCIQWTGRWPRERVLRIKCPGANQRWNAMEPQHGGGLDDETTSGDWVLPVLGDDVQIRRFR